MKNHLFFVGIAATGIVATGSAQSAPSAFSDADKHRAAAFWQSPDRYRVAPAEKGEVRLTVEGSLWLYKYARSKGGGKINPVVDAKPVGAPKMWEDWINARVAFDRAEAQAKLEGTDDSTSSPTDPGPCPADLVQLVGLPPPFAEACTPNVYTIHFDDGDITYTDHVKVRPRYVYYRFARGVEDGGTSVKSLSPDRIDHLFRLAGIDPKVANVMRSVSALEGGFDSVNTYDTGFVSVGFIQFASLRAGAGSLGSMMLTYKANDQKDFDRDFRQYGVDVTGTGQLDVLDPVDGDEFLGPDANTRIIEDKRLVAVFGHAGAHSDAFMAAQIASAKGQFYPDADTINVKLGADTQTVRVCDLIRSEAGMATLMDRKVNTGRIDPCAAVVQRVADAHGVTTLAELCEYESEIVAQLKYRKDYMADLTLSQPTNLNGLEDRHKSRRDKR